MKHDLWVISDEIYARILFTGEYQVDLRPAWHGGAHGDYRWLLENVLL